MKNCTFFELLQVAVGNRSSLSCVLSDADWVRLHEDCKKHALLGVGFVGIQNLSTAGSEEVRRPIPPIELLSQWLYEASLIKEKNAAATRECKRFCGELEHDGINCCVLKGQSNLVNYTENLRDFRTPGDIDLWAWTTGKIKPIVDYAQRFRDEHNQGLLTWDRILYYHVEMRTTSGVDAEIHYRPSWLASPFCNSHFRKWYTPYLCSVFDAPDGFNIPSVSFNAVYQLVHIFRHLFDEGIGLRQLLDYYFVLKKLAECPGQDVETMRVLKSLHLDKLAAAVMYVLQTVFAMPDEYLICEPDEKEGRWLLNEIMEAGNFGKYDKRKGDLTNESSFHKFIRKTKHSLSLVKHYPHEALWEPGFRLYHFFWRKLRLWRFQ